MDVPSAGPLARWNRRWWMLFTLLALFASSTYFLFEHRAFLNLRFFAIDYGMYDNTVWNIAHGNGFFTSAKGKTYLSVHFSPILAVLAPLYLLKDTALWLMAVQSAALGASALLLAEFGRRLGLTPATALVLTLVYCFEPLAQRVYLAEFHTVALQAPLVFAFALSLLSRRRLLPILWALLLLGTREDAFIGLAPLAFFLAWRMRWWYPAALGAGAIFYGWAVIQFAFPFFSGQSLFDRRKSGFQLFESFESFRAFFRKERFAGTLHLLPHAMLALFAGGWLVVTFTPLLQIFLSGFPKQYLLEEHYAATLRPYLYLAMAAGTASLIRMGGSTPARRWLPWTLLIPTAAITLFLNVGGSLMPPFPNAHPVYRSVYPRYRELRSLAGRIPPDASVGAPDHVYPHVAHRREAYRYAGEPLDPPPDFYLLDASTGRGRFFPWDLTRLVEEGGYSLEAAAGRFALLRRGEGQVRFEDYRSLFYLLETEVTPRKIGVEVAEEDASSGMARRGDNGADHPEFLSFGRPWPLGEGEYLCVLRARNPAGVEGGKGFLEAFDFEAQTSIALKPFVLPPGEGWSDIELPFVLHEPKSVEIRVAVEGRSSLTADRIHLDGAAVRRAFEEKTERRP